MTPLQQELSRIKQKLNGKPGHEITTDLITALLVAVEALDDIRNHKVSTMSNFGQTLEWYSSADALDKITKLIVGENNG